MSQKKQEKQENQEKLEQVLVRGLAQLKQAILPFQKINNEPKSASLATNISYQEDGKTVDRRVEVIVQEPRARDLLLQGLELVKNRLTFMNANKAAVENAEDGEQPITVVDLNPDEMYFYVDSLIRNRLDGKRRGLKIRWELAEGNFEWDPFEDKLEQVQ